MVGTRVAPTQAERGFVDRAPDDPLPRRRFSNILISMIIGHSIERNGESRETRRGENLVGQ